MFRIAADDWPLLEAAARNHGSLQAAILAGLHALQGNPAAEQPDEPQSPNSEHPPAEPAPANPSLTPPADEDPGAEIHAREAAQILGLKTSTVSGYIRSGRLPGRYDGAPAWRGWVTNRAAVTAYQQRIRANR